MKLIYVLCLLYIPILSLYPCSIKADTLINIEDYQNKFGYNIEIKGGMEIARGIPAAIISFKVPPNDIVSFVPEMSFILGIMPSVSLRYQVKPSKNIRSFLQGGHGYMFFVGPASFLCTGIEIKINRMFYLQSEIRILFPSRSDLYFDDLNIQKHKPLILSIGLAF